MHNFIEEFKLFEYNQIKQTDFEPILTKDLTDDYTIKSKTYDMFYNNVINLDEEKQIPNTLLKIMENESDIISKINIDKIKKIVNSNYKDIKKIYVSGSFLLYNILCEPKFKYNDIDIYIKCENNIETYVDEGISYQIIGYPDNNFMKIFPYIPDFSISQILLEIDIETGINKLYVSKLFMRSIKTQIIYYRYKFSEQFKRIKKYKERFNNYKFQLIEVPKVLKPKYEEDRLECKKVTNIIRWIYLNYRIVLCHKCWEFVKHDKCEKCNKLEENPTDKYVKYINENLEIMDYVFDCSEPLYFYKIYESNLPKKYTLRIKDNKILIDESVNDIETTISTLYETRYLFDRIKQEDIFYSETYKIFVEIAEYYKIKNIISLNTFNLIKNNVIWFMENGNDYTDSIIKSFLCLRKDNINELINECFDTTDISDDIRWLIDTDKKFVFDLNNFTNTGILIKTNMRTFVNFNFYRDNNTNLRKNEKILSCENIEIHGYISEETEDYGYYIKNR